MMCTRLQFPSGRRLHDRSAVSCRHHTACRAAERNMKNGRGFSQLFLDEKGTAAIEFGVIGAFLCLLLVGLVDFGMGYWQQMQVGNAARAGAEYAVLNGGNNLSAITTAV